MCGTKINIKNFGNVNDGDTSRYNILNSFYEKKSELSNELKKSYMTAFDEEIFNVISDKKEEELINSLGLYKMDSCLNIETKSDFDREKFKLKQYMKYISIKKYLKKERKYERLEYLYDVSILKRFLKQKNQFNDVRLLYKKQSLNCVKSLRAALNLPFDYNNTVHMHRKLFLFILLSLPAFISCVISFVALGIISASYVVRTILVGCNNFLNNRQNKYKKVSMKYNIISLLFNINNVFIKINSLFAKSISTVSDYFYSLLSSYQFKIFKRIKKINKINKNPKKYINSDKKINKIRKAIDKNNLIKEQEKKKSCFYKDTEDGFDKIIYSITTGEKQVEESTLIDDSNVIKLVI